MRHVPLAIAVLVTTILGAGPALSAPFEPATIPDAVGVAGHLDVDVLRGTQLFAAVGGQAAVDAALDGAPTKLRSIARSLSRSVRGVSFWRDGDHGAVYIETRDSKSLGHLIAQLPATPAPAIDGFPAYTLDDDSGSHGFCAVYAHTLVLADSLDSLARSLRVLGGKAANLAGSSKLPASTRQGLFVFVTIGDNALGAIQKSAQAKVLQLGLRAIVIDAGESAGYVTATARAEMQSADAVQKAKAILDGVRAMASLSDVPSAQTLIDAVNVTVSGLTLTVSAKLPVAEVARLIRQTK